MMVQTPRNQTETLATLLKTKGLKVATAESCTGGGIAKVLTDLAGSSDWFECGFVTYSNESKQSMLGVDANTLSQWGAVSEAVVKEMAEGVLARSYARLAVAVSGVAGPGGGSPGKPVGTVWVAWALQEQGVTAECFHFQGDRDAVRCQTIEAAIEGLMRLASAA